MEIIIIFHEEKQFTIKIPETNSINRKGFFFSHKLRKCIKPAHSGSTNTPEYCLYVPIKINYFLDEQNSVIRQIPKIVDSQTVYQYQ